MNFSTASNSISSSIIIDPIIYYYNYNQLTQSFNKSDFEFKDFVSNIDTRDIQKQVDDAFTGLRSIYNYIPITESRFGYANSFSNLLTESANRMNYSFETSSLSNFLYYLLRSQYNWSMSFVSLIQTEMSLHSTYLQYITAAVNNVYVDLTPQGQALYTIISGNYSNLVTKNVTGTGSFFV